MNKIKYQSLILKLLHAARDSMSCLAFSKALGFNYNIAHRWEAQSRKLYWSEFVLICNFKDWDLLGLIQSITGKKFEAIPSSSELLSYICSIESNYKQIEKVISIPKIDRIRKGHSKLTIDDLLLIIDVTYSRVDRFSFKTELLGESSESTPSAEYSNLCRQDPQFSILKSCLVLDRYVNSENTPSNVLAKLMNMTVREVEIRLNILFEMGIVTKSDQHFVIVEEHIDLGTKHKDNSRFTLNYWRKQMSKFVDASEKDLSKHASAFLIYSTNSDLEKELFELSNTYYTNLKNAVRKHESSDALSETVRVMALDFFTPLDNQDVLNDVY